MSAENPGRIDVAQAVGSTAMTMFIYDPDPGEGSSPHHDEYEEEWLLVVEALSSCGPSTARIPFKRGTAVPWAEGEEGWKRAD